LSFRDPEDFLAQRGITVSYEAIRLWCRRFGPEYARLLRRRQGRLGAHGTWDELFVNIHGRQQYLWRVVDQNGDVIDILLQPRRDRNAAERFFRKLLKGQGRTPRRLITDKLRSYSAAHGLVMPSAVHSTQQDENNRAEVSQLVRNLFRVGCHLLRAFHQRLLRARSFVVWNEVTCAC
jgi:putative transposase